MNLSNNKFFSLMSLVGQLILLNLLYILTAFPIITLGASNCALYSVLKKILKKEESYIIKDYFKEFKSNFKNGTIIGLFAILATIILYILSKLFIVNNTNLFIISIFIGFLIVYMFIFIYAFPLQSTFVNTPLNLMRNSFLTALKHLPMSILLCITTFTPLAISWLSPQYLFITFPYWFFIGFSVVGLCSYFITSLVFKEYMTKSDI